MIYSFSLQAVAVAIGLLWIALHLPGLLRPAAAGAALRRFPRNVPAGIVLLSLGLVWAAWLCLTFDLGEFTPLRTKLLVACVVLGGAMLAWSREFLAVRGLAVLLLLGADVVLDAAFLRDEWAKLILVAFAYAWIVAALVLLFSPFRLRDAIAFATATPQRLRAFAAGGAAFGALLVFLGLFVY
jgi:hypothetical protein